MAVDQTGSLAIQKPYTLQHTVSCTLYLTLRGLFVQAIPCVFLSAVCELQMASLSATENFVFVEEKGILVDHKSNRIQL